VPTPNGLASGSGLGLAYQRGQRLAWRVRLAFIRQPCHGIRNRSARTRLRQQYIRSPPMETYVRSALVPSAKASERHRCYAGSLIFPACPTGEPVKARRLRSILRPSCGISRAIRWDDRVHTAQISCFDRTIGKSNEPSAPLARDDDASFRSQFRHAGHAR
jgi:hypothetical protein